MVGATCWRLLYRGCIVWDISWLLLGKSRCLLVRNCLVWDTWWLLLGRGWCTSKLSTC